MKNIFLFVLALTAVSAWAADSTIAPRTQEQSGHATRSILAADTGVSIKLNGPAKDIAALAADLEKDAVYNKAGCSSAPGKKSKTRAAIKCAKPDSALMEFLTKNAPAGVSWSISAAAGEPVAACPSGCVLTNCPPPSGPIKCCNTTTFQPC